MAKEKQTKKKKTYGTTNARSEECENAQYKKDCTT